MSEESKIIVAPNGVIVSKEDRMVEIVYRNENVIDIQIRRKLEDGEIVDKPTCTNRIEGDTLFTNMALSVAGAQKLVVGLLKYFEFIEDFEKNSTKNNP